MSVIPKPVSILETSELKTGVYLIHNCVRGKNYVGSAAISIKARLGNHISCLRGGYHGNDYLQNSWKKYGEAAFEFYVLELCLPEMCIEREQYWIDYYEASDDRMGYNISPTAGNTLGVKHSKETRERVRAAVMARRTEIALNMLGNNHGKGNLGKVPSQAKRDAIAAKLTGRKLTEEHKASLKKTPEQLEAIRQRTTGVKQSPETIAKRVLKLRGKKRSPESRRNISEGRKLAKLKREAKMAEILATG